METIRRSISLWRYAPRGLGSDSGQEPTNFDVPRPTRTTGRELMEGGLRIELAEEPGAVVAGPNGAAFRRDVGAGERWDKGS